MSNAFGPSFASFTSVHLNYSQFGHTTRSNFPYGALESFFSLFIRVHPRLNSFVLTLCPSPTVVSEGRFVRDKRLFHFQL
jgi:hypothetical protein